MEGLTAEEVKKALSGWLGPKGRVDVSRDGPGGRITGWVVHPQFAGISRSDRQSWLWNGHGEEGALPKWKGLHGKFQERSTQIGLVLTYSPAEYENAFDETA